MREGFGDSITHPRLSCQPRGRIAMKLTKKVLRCQVCHHLVEIEPHTVVGHVCAQCLERQDYQRRNYKEKGGWSRLPRFSFEFEIDVQQWGDLERATVLLRHGFVRTH